MRNRVNRFFNAWYQPEYSMDREDWLYCAYLLVACLWAFMLGLIIGWVIS